MQVDKLDALFPRIDNDKCIGCDICRNICPNNHNLKFNSVRSVYAVWSKNETTRLRSASGGVAAELYNYFLKNNGFCSGVRINELREAVFISLQGPKDIQFVQNSKYVYSYTNTIYRQIKEQLEQNIPSLFVGLPCQVAGLKSFLRKEYQNLLTVDLVCHGVVPTEYMRQHIESIERKKGSKAKCFSFRDPEYKTSSYTFTLRDERQAFYKKQVYENDTYQLGYHTALIYRENCYECKYARRERLGDLTLCDFSGLGLKEKFCFEKNNVSCVLENTKKGEELLHKLTNRLEIIKRPLQEAFEYEPQLNHPYERHPQRGIFTSIYNSTHDFEFAASMALIKQLSYYYWNTIVVQRYQKLRRAMARYLHRPSIPYGAVLMFHKIDNLDENGVWNNEHLKISPRVIEDMVTYAHSRGCVFVSIDEITRERHFAENPRKLIAITLDDGYRDNFLNGAAVFKRLNIPYCIYVCTKMVEGKMLYWWEILEWLITREEQVTVTLPNGTEKIFDCSSRLKKEQAFLDIREIILHLPQDRLLEQIQDLFSRYDIDYTYGNDTLGLTWDQIQELTRDPFCTIGNHTFSHLAFTGCCDEEITKDILRAQESMKSKTSYEMRHFAFPFGEAAAVSQHDIDLVKGLGFQTSATTNDGLVCYGSDRMELPRIFVTEKNWKEVIDRIAENC